MMIKNTIGKKRILLMQPPFYRLYSESHQFARYPLSLGYLAGAVRSGTGWCAMVYNADFCRKAATLGVSYLAGKGFYNYLRNLKDLSGRVWSEIRDTVKDYAPAVVGISANSQNFASACLVARIVKEIDPGIVVIVGGPHPSMAGASVLDCRDIDISVKGEGELTIVELLEAIESGRGLDCIKGIFYRQDGRVMENQARGFIEDLDTLGFPSENARETLKDYPRYGLEAFQYIFATRGCPYNCFFCGSRNIWSQRVRFRSAGNVIKEIQALQRIGLHKIHFSDDTFGVTRRYIEELCEAMIKGCRGIKWGCEIHVKLVDDMTIALMKKAGCVSIQVGIESGNNEMLKKIRKNITIEEALEACEVIKRHRIMLQTFFIAGFPEETEETLNDTLAAMKKTKCDRVAYSIFTPYPGTESFEFCRKHGLIGTDYNVSLYNHQSPLNHFCANIPQERFRELASKIEAVIDKRNLSSMKRELAQKIFSPDIFWKIHDKGIANSLRKGMRIVFGR